MSALVTLPVTEQDPLVAARNEASVIVFAGLDRYAQWLDIEPAFEGDMARYYGWSSGGRCGHPRSFADEKVGICTLCGWCWHRRIIRERPGSRDEIQYCDHCGEEKTRVWRGGDVSYDPPTYHGF